ncbi:glycine-rich cell wall structural protein 1-like [Amphibalanus amphitrite]|uniref:glycine-rich cell wall structural protein 1-like n=1 Tax=Amphibalanus amphitrite TaxID=1232801 RepID=UPI001C928A33|nr:glycine-rich cell wall structural protein 1-like [Amphibalanus amphitrite]
MKAVFVLACLLVAVTAKPEPLGFGAGLGLAAGGASSGGFQAQRGGLFGSGGFQGANSHAGGFAGLGGASLNSAGSHLGQGTGLLGGRQFANTGALSHQFGR